MALVSLNVSLINKTKEEILNVLQGISRYIDVIHVQELLISNEGIDILTFLKKRYPKKKIIVDISTARELNDKYMQLIKRCGIKNFIISSELTSYNLKKFVDFLKKHKKNIIVRGKKFQVKELKKLGIKDLFFYQAQPKKKDRLWSKTELTEMNKLIEDGFALLIGDVNVNNLPSLHKIPANGFVISEEICYSFNPIETSKQIYLKIKLEYTED